MAPSPASSASFASLSCVTGIPPDTHFPGLSFLLFRKFRIRTARDPRRAWNRHRKSSGGPGDACHPGPPVGGEARRKRNACGVRQASPRFRMATRCRRPARRTRCRRPARRTALGGRYRRGPSVAQDDSAPPLRFRTTPTQRGRHRCRTFRQDGDLPDGALDLGEQFRKVRVRHQQPVVER
jgi:hypothetical protein